MKSKFQKGDFVTSTGQHFKKIYAVIVEVLEGKYLIEFRSSTVERMTFAASTFDQCSRLMTEEEKSELL